MQFGHTFQRVLQKVVHANPAFSPVEIIKLDLADGYYRIPVSSSGVQQLGIILPPMMAKQPLIAFPLALPKGWSESLPLFCMFMEMVANITNTQ